MRKYLAGCFLLVCLAACGPSRTTAPDIGTAAPFQAATASSSLTVLPGLTEIVLPTPTTFSYTIVQGDTLGGIASRFGVTLEALIAANPGVQPTALRVGQKLVIPSGNQVPGEPTPTPAPLVVVQTHCWPESTGGLWCFALLRNDFAETVENLSAQFSLLGPGGQVLASQTVNTLLDILPPGGSMPVQAHFPPPVPGQPAVRVQVLTSTRILPGDTRYLPVEVDNTLVGLDASGRTAQLSGRVTVGGAGSVNTLWVLATAYDAAGNVVGVRRWAPDAAVSAGTPIPFAFQVFSLGPEIARVDFLAEARP
jgi:LysM repeat protein